MHRFDLSARTDRALFKISNVVPLRGSVVVIVAIGAFVGNAGGVVSCCFLGIFEQWGADRL